jgi:hypothetical protein
MEDALQRFKKPEKEFLKDKECLICLEPIDLEMNQIVKLPCGCANSAYHIPCILQLLGSGENKNFCPHCKTEYNLFLKQFISVQPLVVQPVVDLLNQFTHIMLVHLISNTLMNIINIAVSRSYPEYNREAEFQVLMLFYFLKLFINFSMLVYAKNDIERIETVLVYSYVYQTVLIGLLIYILAKIKNDSFTTALLVNNLLFGITDLAYRFVVEYKMRNRVANG